MEEEPPTPMTLEERFNRFLGCTPRVDATAFVHRSAVIIGDVTLGPHSSVWPMVVLRGDIESIEIGEGSNVQDGTVVHLADDLGVKVGAYTTIGHGAIIHACTIGDECLIGMGATILDGAVIGRQCIIGARALVPKGMVVPDGSMVIGLPGKVVKTLSDPERGQLRSWAEKYVQVASAFRRLDPD